MRSTAVDVCLIALYVAAIVTANWLVTEWGQAALPLTAFLLIPFDLVVRDLLQDRWQVRDRYELWCRMSILIFGGAALSYVTTVASQRIALASFTAFALAGAIDAATYQWMIRRGRIFRINLATVIAAITDTTIFVAVAFDEADLGLIIAQVASKAAGGFFWSIVMFRFFRVGPRIDGGSTLYGGVLQGETGLKRLGYFRGEFHARPPTPVPDSVWYKQVTPTDPSPKER